MSTTATVPTERFLAQAPGLSAAARAAVSASDENGTLSLSVAHSDESIVLEFPENTFAEFSACKIRNAGDAQLLLRVAGNKKPAQLTIENLRGARLQLFIACDREDMALDSRINLAEDSQLDCFLHVSRVSADIKLKADIAQGATGRFSGLTQAVGENAVSIHMHVHHLQGKNLTEQKFYSYAADASTVTFTGLITVDAGASEAVAHQLHRGTALSTDARISAQPFLNISHDDVRCTHGSTVGFIDETARRFLMARGLDAVQAEKILIDSSQRQFIDMLPETAASFFHLNGGEM